MFQSRALRGFLLLFVITLSLVKAEVFIDDDAEAVIIQAPKEKQSDGSNRNGRQFHYYPNLGIYPNLVLTGVPQTATKTTSNEPCTTSENRTGTCMTINECHPTWKVFRTEPKDSWAFGLYNTCYKDGADGREVNGVCCPDNKNEKMNTDVLQSKEKTGSMNQDGNERATACLLTNTQKQQIQNSQCTKRNVKRDAIAKEDAFIAKATTWPFAGFNPQNPFVQRFVWRYRRAIDLGCANIGCSPVNQRIIGGRPINPHQFKFVAALLTEDYQGRVRQFCGGSVIDEYHILTAAHCVASYTEDDVRRLRVQLGVHNIKNTPGKSTHKVDRIIRHIDFSQRTLDNDVAILTLNTPAPIHSNGNIKPVCMLAGGDKLESRSAIVSGWGSLKFGTSKFPKELHSVNVKVWNNNLCNNNYGAQAPGGITARMLCASLPGKDSCQGDSGGALFTCAGSSDCTQIGIVSWGIGCAQAQYPGVYTRVTEMIDWIQRITSCY